MKRMAFAGLALAALGLGLTGCEKDPLGRSAADVRSQKVECDAKGGTWGPGGITGADMCFFTLPDGGNACSSGLDCEGMCVADDSGAGGTCQSVRPMFGCIPFFDDEGNRAEICVD